MISLQGLEKQYGPKVLFQNVSTHFTSGDRVGLIGANGAGKSTLLKMILGIEHPDSGQIERERNTRIGVIEQEILSDPSTPILEVTKQLGQERQNILDEKNALEDALSKNPSNESLLSQYSIVLDQYESLDEYTLEPRAKAILLGLGFSVSQFEEPIQSLSGGWKMRVLLARLLLKNPDIMILDEPTNHLDLESILWLENFLRHSKAGFILVSHDQKFLNRVVDKIWELENQKLTVYKGNYTEYLEQKTERLELLKAQYANQQSKIQEIQSFIDRFKAKATKAKQAQSRVKMLEKMDKISDPSLLSAQQSMKLRFPPCPASGKEVITFKELNFSYTNANPIFKNLNLYIQRGSRIALTGVNGAGKSTFLKLISGSLSPQTGSLTFGHNVKIGYYAQEQSEQLNPKQTVLEALYEIAPLMPQAQIRGVAGAFLFSGDDVLKKIGILSGGEKARVALAQLLLSPFNFLVLDEPTNHLDMESKEILKDALEDYEGTLLLVSHDRQFVDGIVNHVLEVKRSAGKKESEVISSIGSYQDYLEKLLLEQETKTLGKNSEKNSGTSVSLNTGAPTGKTAPTLSNNQRIALTKKVSKIEKEISEIEEKQQFIASQLSDSTIYQNKAAALDLMKTQTANEAKLKTLFQEWEDISKVLDSPQG